jgi:cobalt-zinc-cadmium efflux system membrane fusion protein
MTTRGKVILRAVVITVIALALVVGIVAATPFVQPMVKGWLHGHASDDASDRPGDKPSHELVRDKEGRPVRPFTMRLAPETVKSLQITTGNVRKAGKLVLPTQTGSLGYDTDRLYPVRSLFQGQVVEIAEAAVNGRLESFQKFQKRHLLGPGDRVKQGQVLAVVWSKELGDRKVALVSALLDLYVDQETLQRLEEIYQKGSVPEATYRTAVAKVERDLASVYAAEAGLGISRLRPEEIEEVRNEARTVQKRLRGKPETPDQRKQRIAEEVKKWARVVLKAPILTDDPDRELVVVEKNTNLTDMVDPSRDTPLFRLADMSTVLINVNFNEEYLPLLQPLLGNAPAGMRWQVRLEAVSDFPELDLPILRIAPSLDPNNHTAVVIGRLANPVQVKDKTRHLVVGQFCTATVAVPPVKGIVDIPTNALNEVDGESLVFVQADPAKPEYTLRRVVVVRRSRDVTQVRSELTATDKKLSAAEVEAGRPPLSPLRIGDLVVTHSVTEMTEAMQELLAKARAQK